MVDIKIIICIYVSIIELEMFQIADQTPLPKGGLSELCWKTVGLDSSIGGASVI